MHLKIAVLNNHKEGRENGKGMGGEGRGEKGMGAEGRRERTPRVDALRDYYAEQSPFRNSLPKYYLRRLMPCH
jgi:hypothetical protein